MAEVQAGGEEACLRVCGIQVGDQVAEVEVVEHHDPGYLLQQGEHMGVEQGVAELVQHPIKLAGMLAKPGHIPQRAVGLNPGMDHPLLVHYHLHPVVACQRFEQFRAVVGDAGTLRRQGRDECQAGPGVGPGGGGRGSTLASFQIDEASLRQGREQVGGSPTPGAGGRDVGARGGKAAQSRLDPSGGQGERAKGQMAQMAVLDDPAGQGAEQRDDRPLEAIHGGVGGPWMLWARSPGRSEKKERRV